MKKISLFLCILICLIFIFTLSACSNYDGYEVQPTYAGMNFWLMPQKTENGKDYYYLAKDLNDRQAQNYFIPMFVNGLPVRSFGGSGYGKNYMDLYLFALKKLYFPGTIINKMGQEKYIDRFYWDMQIFYCGEVIDLYAIYPYSSDKRVDYYVPAEKFDEFENVFGSVSTNEPTTSSLYKANIVYRLNCDDMCQYYYVDYVEAGSKIVNIPPEPTRTGYTFDGWYTEQECTNKWNFDNVPTLSNGDEPFVEFALFAKWVKK